MKKPRVIIHQPPTPEALRLRLLRAARQAMAAQLAVTERRIARLARRHRLDAAFVNYLHLRK